VYVPISTFGELLALPLSITRSYKVLFWRMGQIGNRQIIFATDTPHLSNIKLLFACMILVQNHYAFKA
jgi:hypothetical protein